MNKEDRKTLKWLKERKPLMDELKMHYKQDEYVCDFNREIRKHMSRIHELQMLLTNVDNEVSGVKFTYFENSTVEFSGKNFVDFIKLEINSMKQEYYKSVKDFIVFLRGIIDE